MTENENIKCGSNQCINTALVMVYWPGQTLPMCELCVLKAKGLANAMGFNLSIGRLDNHEGLCSFNDGHWRESLDH